MIFSDIVIRTVRRTADGAFSMGIAAKRLVKAVQFRVCSSHRQVDQVNPFAIIFLIKPVKISELFVVNDLFIYRCIVLKSEQPNE